MTILINLLFYIGLSLLWINAEPMIYLKRFLGFKEEEYDTYKPFKRFIHRGIHCLFCSSFWLTLIVSQSFYMAVIVSGIAWFIDNKI
jgi:hypothetical protein